MFSLREWQKTLKSDKNIIVNASHPNEQDEMIPWPIGMCYHYKKAREVLSCKELQIGQHQNLLMCGFCPGNDHRRRKDMSVNRYNIMETLSRFIKNEMYDPSQYFSKLPHYKFVISPEGNGIDCHRHYEALMAGCIPIVEHNDEIKEKYGNVPILYTTDYSEITPEYLERKYEEMIDNEYDYSRLFLDYYDEDTKKTIIYCSRFWTLRFYGELWYDEEYGKISEFSPDRDLSDNEYTFSLAIPTMRRFENYLKENIPKYLENKFINEIVICDETGEDYDSIKKEYGDHPKIKLYKNDYKLGGFRNKIKVMSLCSSKYIALIDSDNYVGEDYFQEAINFGLNSYSVLLPCNSDGRNSFKPLSFFNYIDHDNWINVLKTHGFFPRMNDGNGIYPKKYSELLKILVLDIEPHACDAFVINQIAVSMGFKLYFVPNMGYKHPTSDDSYWITTEKESNDFMSTWNSNILNFVKLD